MQPRVLYRISLISAVSLCWLVCTVAQVEKYLPMHWAIGMSLLGFVCIAVMMAGLDWLWKTRHDAKLWAVLLVFAALVLSFAVIYPKSQKHAPGKGSDREDALRVELVAVTHHQYPYDARTFLDHPPTPLPGAMLLASPFFLTSRIAFQNLVWAAIFLAMLLHFFRRRITVLAFFVIFFLTALENLNDFAVGGDYITNIMYVAVALFLFDRAIRKPGFTWSAALSIIFLGVAVSSRILYVVALIPLLALALQQTQVRRALSFMGLAVLAAAAVTFPVFFPHPVSRFLIQLGQNADKLRHLPHWLPGASLPVASLAFACTAFFIRMNLARVYLIFGLCSLIMVLPPMLSVVSIDGGLGHQLSTDLEYLAVSAIFISLWIFSRLEQIGIESSTAPASGGC